VSAADSLRLRKLGRRPREVEGRLRDLEALKGEFGRGASAKKLELLAHLERARFSSARAVSRLHEVLCFLRAYPDDQAVAERVEHLLSGFAARRDLVRHRSELFDSGIAGTDIYYRFFQPTADFLARKYASSLRIDWADFDRKDRLERMLSLLALYCETPGLDEETLGPRAWIERLKGPDETDAAFLIRRFGALSVDEFVREQMFEELDVPMRLSAGPDTPSRTRARYGAAPIAYQTRPLRRERPDIARELSRPPRSIRAVSESEGKELVLLARESMITRSRDLDAFAHGDPRDVRVVDCGEGLQFACIGVRPERRLMLESVYGFLTLKNGMPIGYVLASALFNSCEVAYNVFETFRGGEAGHVYGRVLAMLRALFSADTFTIYPYQLGHENEEGLRSGSFWFYQKLGFRPRDPDVLKVLRREEGAMRRDPKHRSDRATLKVLATENVFWSSARARDDVIGVFPLGSIGLAITDSLAARFGADRERGLAVSAAEAGQLLGERGWKRLPPGERLAWERWSPLVLILPGIERWNAADRRALARVVRAKGGRRESDFSRLFDRHRRLRRALCRIAATT
jgi:hypothetical protein